MKFLLLFLVAVLCSFVTSAGVTTSYHLYSSAFDTCDVLSFAGYSVPFNVCSLVNTGLQPNCTIYFNCLLPATSFDIYQACLTPTAQAYDLLLPLNVTFFQRLRYSDFNCTTLVSTTIVPFACTIGGVVDANSTVCGLNVFDAPSTITTSGASVLSGFWF